MYPQVLYTLYSHVKVYLPMCACSLVEVIEQVNEDITDLSPDKVFAVVQISK